MRVPTRPSHSGAVFQPHDVDRHKGGRLPDDAVLPNFTIAEISPRDVKILPHMYDDADIENMILTLAAAPLQPNTDDWAPGSVEDCGVTGKGQTETGDAAAAARKQRTRGRWRVPAE